MELYDIRHTFTPLVYRYIETLLAEGKVGICAGNIKVKSPLTSCPAFNQSSQCDRFKLTLPYAGTSITWEVLFDGGHPGDPPDFIFQEDDFYPNLQELKSLSTWDPNDPHSLRLLVQDLLVAYGNYQRSLIDNKSRLSFEYTTLLEECKIEPSDIEVLVTKPDGKSSQIFFLIKLNIDFSKLPAYLMNNNPGEDSAVLQVCFSSPEDSRATAQLYLSPRVESALGGNKHLRIPSFPAGGHLTDYHPVVYELLKTKVEQVVKGYEKRKEYIAAFLTQFGSSVLEYDVDKWNKISFLFEWHDFFFTFHIELPLYFPKEQPVFCFQSVYHSNKGKPFQEEVTDFPYSPRWSSAEMVERARTYILDNIRNFQMKSVMGGLSGM